MSRKKSLQCGSYDCEEPLYRGGLCREHYEKDLAASRTRSAAIDLLHLGTLDQQLIADERLRQELDEVRSWWRLACSLRQVPRNDDRMPYIEADYAMEWCIAIATDLIGLERAYRCGSPSADLGDWQRKHHWERFGYLAAGHQSNGRPRDRRTEDAQVAEVRRLRYR